MLADTYELTKQVIAYRAHFDSASGTGSDPLLVNELRDKNHRLEKNLQDHIDLSTRLAEQNL
jgi:hypothetical protein